MFKFISTVLILQLSLFCQNEEEKNITHIILKTSFFGSNRPFSIYCESFEKYANITYVDTITSITELLEFKAIIGSLEKYKYDKFKYGLDTRAKILVFYDNKQIDTICINLGYVEYNHNFYKISKDLLYFIRKYNPEAVTTEDIEGYFLRRRNK